jgi:PAS domain S-box-containing protein
MTSLPFSTDAVLESLNDGFQAFDLEWRYVYLNRRAEQILGRSRDELLGKVCWEEYPEAVGTPFHAHYLEAAETGANVVFESFCPHEKRWAEFSLHPYPGGVGAFTRDITERKEAEEAMLHSEMQYHALFDGVQSAIVLADDSGRYIDANPAACSVLGMSYDRLLTKSILDVAPPGNGPGVKSAWRQFLQDGTQSGDFTVIRPDGTMRLLEYRAKANVRPGIHISIMHDVTDRRVAEDRARALLEDLKDERETLDTINRVGRLLSAELDLDRLVQAATDAATELTGAQFGAFFYNVTDSQGESYLLYTISGVPREAFSRFPHPRATPLFGPTFQGEGIIRSGDITNDPRYGRMEPFHGMPAGHLPVRSYLAVPVLSRSGEVLGGLFFGHEDPDIFSERAERNLVALVAQIAIAVDNARLFRQAQWEIEERWKAEEELRRSVRHTALRADVSTALAQGGGLPEILKRCALRIVEHLDVALARLWTLDLEEDVLVLQATACAGPDMHAPYGPVAAGKQTISITPLDRIPTVTNDIAEVEHTVTKEWAQQEGIIAAARNPLLLDDRVIGVVEVFTRRPLAPTILEEIGSVAPVLAQGVERMRVEQRLAESEQRQRTLLKDVLDSVTEGRLRLCETLDDLPEAPLPIMGEPIPLTVKTLCRLRSRAAAAAEAVGLDSDRRNDLITAAGEAGMNAVVHGGGGIAIVGVDAIKGTVRLTVEDWGAGIAMNHLPRATLNPGYTTAGTLGYGFKMVLSLVDTVWLLTGPTGTTVVIEQGRNAPLPTWALGLRSGL